MERLSASAARDGALGVALAVAFSPVLIDLLRDYASDPAARFGLVAAVALALAWIREPREQGGHAVSGGGMIGLGLALAMVAIAADTSFPGRVGLALAVAGLARLRGHPSLRASVLAGLSVPIPVSALASMSPVFESGVATLATAPLRFAGLEIVVSGGTLHAGPSLLQLFPMDGGVPLAWAGAALGWSFARPTWGAALRGATAGATLAFAVQLALLAVAGLAAAAGASALARVGLDAAGLTLALAVLALGPAWRRSARRADRARG